MCRDMGIGYLEVYIDIERDQAKLNNNKREDRVPEDVIERM